jgi:hypothetical protein
MRWLSLGSDGGRPRPRARRLGQRDAQKLGEGDDFPHRQLALILEGQDQLGRSCRPRRPAPDRVRPRSASRASYQSVEEQGHQKR